MQSDGWITSAGFVVCAKKAGLHLTRAQFLALERAVPKDTLGRINFYTIADTVVYLTYNTAMSSSSCSSVSSA
jgi:hypothetical protein